MKKDFLFPHSWRIPGWILAIPCAVTGLFWLVAQDGFIDRTGLRSLFEGALNGFLDEIITIGLIVGLLLVAFSREKDEDEYTGILRGRSLTWALIVNYILIIAATLIFYEFDYLYVLFVDLFLVLILFVAKFKIALYRSRKSARHEE